MIGRVHSFQSLGTVDGPGVRFVVFMQGCPLRCGCCHNPDTLDPKGGNEYTPQGVLDKVLRCRDYFGKDGGITVSGGEPLLQSEFCAELFDLCHQWGIHTCLDTAGCILDEEAKKLLEVTDRVLLDVKFSNDADYLEHVGCTRESVLAFLAEVNQRQIPVTLRQVVIPTLNDGDEDIRSLKELQKQYPVIDKIELLPFKKICQVKYDEMGIEFPFAKYDTPTSEQMKRLETLLNEH